MAGWCVGGADARVRTNGAGGDPSVRDGARIWLARRSLHNVVDSAVLAGANELEVEGLYRDVDALDPASARLTALRLLTRNPMVEEVHVTADRAGVRAVAGAAVPTTFLRLVGIEEIPVAAEAHARPVFGEG